MSKAVSALRSARDHCLAPERADAPIYGGRYRSLFEDLVGIIDGDPESFRSVDPGWSPTLPGRRAGAFGLADILAPV